MSESNDFVQETDRRFYRAARSFWIAHILLFSIMIPALFITHGNVTSVDFKVDLNSKKLVSFEERDPAMDLFPLGLGIIISLIVLVIFRSEHHWKCPNCDEQLPVSKSRFFRGYPKRSKHCPHCGSQLSDKI